MMLDRNEIVDRIRRWKALVVAAVIGILFAGAAGVYHWWQQRSDIHVAAHLSPNDPDRWRVAGRKYLAAHPEEADPDKLAALLLDGSKNEASAEAFVQRKIHEDIEKKRVVVIDSWILAQSEARLAALAALIEQGKRPRKASALAPAETIK